MNQDQEKQQLTIALSNRLGKSRLNMLVAVAGAAMASLPPGVYPAQMISVWFDELDNDKLIKKLNELDNIGKKVDDYGSNLTEAETAKLKAKQRAVKVFGPKQGRWK